MDTAQRALESTPAIQESLPVTALSSRTDTMPCQAFMRSTTSSTSFPGTSSTMTCSSVSMAIWTPIHVRVPPLSPLIIGEVDTEGFCRV
jgi:hypothetical protein